MLVSQRGVYCMDFHKLRLYSHGLYPMQRICRLLRHKSAGYKCLVNSFTEKESGYATKAEHYASNLLDCFLVYVLLHSFTTAFRENLCSAFNLLSNCFDKSFSAIQF